MITSIVQILFWILTLLIIYLFFGYPLILYLLKYVKRPSVNRDAGSSLPVVTLMIPVYNEESVIKEKIENSLELDYPLELLEIVVTSDASTDRTNEIAESYLSKGVIFFVHDRKEGKNALINEYVPKTSGEVIVFTDANAMFDSLALKSMVGKFRDPAVGCVGGRLVYQKGETAVAKGEGFYFKYENFIRKLEGLQGAMVGANGAIYAVRRDLFVPVPSHVPNDFFHPLTVVKRGFSSVFDEQAIAREKPSETAGEEFKRRVRIVARSVGAVREAGKLFGRFKKNEWFYLISHKLLRWLTLPILGTLLICNLFLLDRPFYLLCFVLQAIFYSLGVAGHFVEKQRTKRPLFFIPYYFLLINTAGVVGLYHYIRGHRVSNWETASTTR
jgi:cellulose synthase/poly-beta-1,6-N-acetylglucosamine synthase-like glycosyltransferase